MALPGSTGWAGTSLQRESEGEWLSKFRASADLRCSHHRPGGMGANPCLGLVNTLMIIDVTADNRVEAKALN